MKASRFSLGVILLLALSATSNSRLEGQSNAVHDEAMQRIHQRPHELDGFLLRQPRNAVESALGKPFKSGKVSDEKSWDAYHLPNSPKDYLVVFYYTGKDAFFKGKIGELELTGIESSGPTGFFGLQLGDDALKALKVLGEPSKIRHEDDVNVDLWDYAKDNFSLEFTPDKKLYSIQIIDENGDGSPGFAGSREARIFAQAILDHNLDLTMEMASGEIECSTSTAFGVREDSARKVLGDPKSEISTCLLRAAKAIAAMGKEMKGMDESIRMWEKAAPGTVAKFPPSSPLKEIVFAGEAGAWRVYEVTFREESAHQPGKALQLK